MHLVMSEENHLNSSKDQEGAQHIEHPVESVNQLDPEPNHDPAHNQSAKDAPEKDAMLKLLWHAEIGEDEGDDKDVVHRERQFDQLAREKLEGILPSPRQHHGRSHRH